MMYSRVGNVLGGGLRKFVREDKVKKSFPDLTAFPLVNAVVHEVAGNVKAPVPMIMTGALSVISLVLQGLYDVCKPIGSRATSMSLYLLVIAKSGERKSAVEDEFLIVLKEFERKMTASYVASFMRWEALIKAWEVEQKAILKTMNKKIISGGCVESDKESLVEHSMRKPLKPKLFKMLYEDATPEALLQGMFNNLSSVGLVSSEGGSVLNGRAMRDDKKLNSLWSDSPTSIDRVSFGGFVLDGARLTISLMVQDSEFDSYIKRLGSATRGSGLWSRFLVCRPESIQGTRFIEDDGQGLCCKHRDAFNSRIIKFVDANTALIDQGSFKRSHVRFSAAAARRWIEYFNQTEGQIGKKGRFNESGDHASKLGDNVARVAALLHSFELFEGDISLETVNAAIEICSWYSDQFLEVFNHLPQAELDANELAAWLSRYRKECGDYVPKNHVRQYGPGRIRSKGRLDRALELIEAQGCISIIDVAKVVTLNLAPYIGMSINSYVAYGGNGSST